MNDLTDSQLLRGYAERRSDSAFAELVRRHVDLVYSAALRMVCDSHLAEDVTQGVFVALAQNAAQLTGRSVLSGWLHRTAQNIAAQTVRTIERRRAREQEAAAMNELLAHESEDTWEAIAPHLDAALGELSEADHDALMLRYFERKSAHEMAQTLGISDEAAQKRVSRAVERLREFFANRGVTVGASGLTVVISANAVQAAPVGLAVMISTAAALAGTAVQTSTAIVATKAIAMTTLQKTLFAATLVAAVSVGTYEARQASVLRTEVQALLQRKTPFAEQSEQLGRERDEAARQLAALREESERANRSKAELLKLRNDLARSREEADAALAAAKQLQADIQQTLMSIPPVKTFLATAQTTASWDQAIVTGGWKTPSGKRALVLVTLDHDDNARGQVTIHSKVLEFTEDAGERLGLAQFNSDGQRSKVHTLTSEQSEAILAVAKGSEGVEISAAPSVSTTSGRQAQIQTVRAHSMPTGESFSTGPVIDFIPTISPDGQSVQMVIAAQLNYLVPNPHIKW